MKILHVIPSIDSMQGGPSRALIDMAKALTQKNINNTVVTAEGDSKHFDQSVIAKLNIFPNAFGKRWGFSLALRKWIAANISNYDVVHLHSFFSYTTWCAASEAVKHQIPYVLRPAGSLDQFSFNQKRFKKEIFFRYFGEQILQCAKAVHCTSPFEEKQIRQKMPEAKAIVIPLGTYLIENERSAQKKSSAFLLMYLGRLYQNKGLEIVIEATAKLKRGGETIGLILAGQGEDSYENKLKKLAEKLGVSQNIIWTGFLGEEEKKMWFQKATIFVLPSHHENFGISVVEAMAMGLPVIVSDQVGVAVEIKKATAGLIIQGNVSQLVSAVDYFIKNQKDIERIGENAKNLVEHQFRWPKIADQLIALYQSVKK